VTRPTHVSINSYALLNNLNRVKQYAPTQQIVAMVKANAYGCGIARVIPVLEGQVSAFGVACLEEAVQIKRLGSRTDCILFQGVFSPDELMMVSLHQLQCVIHQRRQLQWLLETSLPEKINVWVKVNTGMNRLGFKPADIHDVLSALMACPWVNSPLGLMTHLACADEVNALSNTLQLEQFKAIDSPIEVVRSVANSATICSMPEALLDVVRPGLMLYGISPFQGQTAESLGLIPVMRFYSKISSIFTIGKHEAVGYGATWRSTRQSRIGIVAAGYGDGYPRHIAPNTPVWINGQLAPLVGRVSMDMMAVDLTDCASVNEGEAVELWGDHLPVERIAAAAGTIAYELICQISPRVHRL
jgi:alanine racemase